MYRNYLIKSRMEGSIYVYLLAYFSASGVTKKAAELLAAAAEADLFEIRPEVPYTKADLNWMDKKSRSTLEMNDPASRPAIAEKLSDMDAYDVIFLGFPIWWYTAPSIIKTFLESYNFAGKKIVLFATSGSSGLGETDRELQKLCPDAKIISGKMLNGSQTREGLEAWVRELNL